MAEKDIRASLFREYTTTPHGNLQSVLNVFNRVRQDGLFFERFMPWVYDNSVVRDHKVAAVIAAVTSAHQSDREIGLALYRQLPVRLAAQVVRQLKDSGLNVPRSLRTETVRYLRDLQADRQTFDKVAAGNREDVKYLFATLHIAPGDYAQRVLFNGENPEGSIWWAIQQAAQSNDPAEVARLVVEYQIPALVASSFLSGPEGVVALVDSMTPAQLQNNLASLKAMGAMDNPELKQMITAKLRQGKKDTRFQSAKREKVSVEDAEIQQALTEVRENVIARQYGIRKPTAMLVDMSSSMNMAIKLAKQLGPNVAQAAENGLWVYAFNDISRPLEAANSLDGWERVFQRIQPHGTTSIGAPVDSLLRDDIRVEQMLFITDEEENASPRVNQKLAEYRTRYGVFNVVVAHVGAGNSDVQMACRALGIQCDVYHWHGDYTALDNLMQLLSGKSRYDIVNEIMAYPIPKRLPN